MLIVELEKKYRMDEDIEKRLIKEAQLMRLKARDFNPYGGLLTVWRGYVYGRGLYRGIKFEIEIRIPPDFPYSPPKIYALTPMEHPAVNKNGEVKLDILEKWNPSIHLYEVVNALKAEFALNPPKPKGGIVLPHPNSVPPPPPSQPVSYPQVVPMGGYPTSVPAVVPPQPSVEALKEILRKKDEEIQSLRKKIEEILSQRGLLQDRKPKTKEELEAEKNAIEEVLKKIEEQFLSGEIKIEEFAKLYKRYTRELFLIKRRLGEL